MSNRSAPSCESNALTDRAAACLMGSATYLWIREHLAEDGWPYRQPTWVMTSKARESIDGADLRFAAGAVADVVAEIEEAVSDPEAVLWLLGGGELAGQFLDAGLLDEMVVSYAPVTLGRGAPLLPRRAQLRLRESEVCGDFVCARFLIDGLRPAADWQA
ncbi:MAG: dihydrofolate reductase family protein [Gordonia sp. (in: high G+C Gram-positive bacteria)]|uniref:dihydrofolate reductase family protein n=1 Tax=Gordonia sp. (in: high G+C Gram-positive bacteria) TaxID=84139 RepID=UPI0039E230D0